MDKNEKMKHFPTPNKHKGDSPWFICNENWGIQIKKLLELEFCSQWNHWTELIFHVLLAKIQKELYLSSVQIDALSNQWITYTLQTLQKWWKISNINSNVPWTFDTHFLHDSDSSKWKMSSTHFFGDSNDKAHLVASWQHHYIAISN